MKSDLLLALGQLAAEKNLPRDIVFDAVESALTSAFKKEGDDAPVIFVRIDRETGDYRVYNQRQIVETVEVPNLEMAVTEARRFKPDARAGDILDFEMPLPENAGRIAAQTAKQVVLQKLREAERDAVFEEYSGKEGEIVVGTVQRIESRQAILELGRGTEASLPASEQIRGEHLRSAQRLKVVILRVERQTKGPQVIVSRAHRTLLRRLFELEVPEVQNGTVEIKSIARDGGHRSKVAVYSRVASIDPIGACVGPRGSRIQNVINELGGERVDIIKFDAKPANFVSNALSPAQVLEVEVDPESKRASVVVPDKMISLAIGKEGQNARLAAKLTGWSIDIRSQAASDRLKAGGEDAATSFVPFVEGEEPDIDVIAEVDETPLVEEVMPAPQPVSRPAAVAPRTPVDDDISFTDAVARMAVPDREERESEDYGEDDDEEYEIPAAIVAEQRPTAIRFAEDVLGRETPEDAAKKPTAKAKARRAPRFQEEEEDEEFDYSGRIH
jgi:N utilization substance protein A